MSSFLNGITPDSFSGFIFAIEGITRSVVLVNGPSGCKFYHSATSDNQSIHSPVFDPLESPDEFFFGQPRIPCTYLDSNDYVYGSADKLERALNVIREKVPHDLVCVVNSPGAALIGDDLRLTVQKALPGARCICIESPGFSQDVTEGYESAMTELFKCLEFKKPARTAGRRVNILGLSILHKYFRGDAAELRRLLGLCGIEVGCLLGADCTMAEVLAMPEAALNVVLHPEYGERTGQWLEAHCGIPLLVLDGPPVGFAATQAFIERVCAHFDIAAPEFFEELCRSRAKAYVHISRVNSLTGLPKGTSVAIEGTPFDIAAYADFLARYFGMVVTCVMPVGEPDKAALEPLSKRLRALNMEDALYTDIADSGAELVFASGNTIAVLKNKGMVFCGVEIALPSLGYIDVLDKTQLGIQGALLITEQVLNGLLF